MRTHSCISDHYGRSAWSTDIELLHHTLPGQRRHSPQASRMPRKCQKTSDNGLLGVFRRPCHHCHCFSSLSSRKISSFQASRLLIRFGPYLAYVYHTFDLVANSLWDILWLFPWFFWCSFRPASWSLHVCTLNFSNCSASHSLCYVLAHTTAQDSQEVGCAIQDALEYIAFRAHVRAHRHLPMHICTLYHLRHYHHSIRPRAVHTLGSLEHDT